jgi:hypothetical protein
LESFLVDARNERLDEIFAEARLEIASHWESSREGGVLALTKERTDRVDARISCYFEALKALPAHASESAVLAQMESLYGDLKKINYHADGGLLETDER